VDEAVVRRAEQALADSLVANGRRFLDSHQTQITDAVLQVVADKADASFIVGVIALVLSTVLAVAIPPIVVCCTLPYSSPWSLRRLQSASRAKKGDQTEAD
jgi:hypothetical protein